MTFFGRYFIAIQFAPLIMAFQPAQHSNGPCFPERGSGKTIVGAGLREAPRREAMEALQRGWVTEAPRRHSLDAFQRVWAEASRREAEAPLAPPQPTPFSKLTQLEAGGAVHQTVPVVPRESSRH